jgi:glutathionylspermidine synthase
MKREFSAPRPNWKSKLADDGVTYHTINNEPYWDESVAYRFELKEIDRIEHATNALHELAIHCIEEIIDRDWFSEMGLSKRARELVIKSWNNDEFDELSVFGRFDFAYDNCELKLLEYNADTPTSLPEAAVTQWKWLEEIHPRFDQFNSIHERLISRWKQLGIHDLHLSCLRESEEDYGNVRYMADVAEQAGVHTKLLFVEDIGWSREQNRFVDTENEYVTNLFKLYPWEWMLSDEFGDRVEAMRVIEPAWKMLLSNKALLAIMWRVAPNHENLLETTLDPMDGTCIRKPTLSREGNNIALLENGQTRLETEGPYGGKFVYQRLASIPNCDRNFPVLGSWIIGEEAAGMGVRESSTPITDNLSRFVPHYIAP